MAKKTKKQSFSDLQKTWYDKLKASGFKDIEFGVDLNKRNAQTLRRQGKPGVQNESWLLWDWSEPGADAALEGWDGEAFYSHPRAVFSDLVSAYAWQLPRNSKKRKIILTVLENGMKKGAKMLKRDLSEVRNVWVATLDRLSLPRAQRAQPREFEQDTPAPVRTLSKAEIKSLNYTAPKKIKDGTSE